MPVQVFGTVMGEPVAYTAKTKMWATSNTIPAIFTLEVWGSFLCLNGIV